MSDEVRARIEEFRKAGIKVVEGGDCAGVVAEIEKDLTLSEEDDMMFVHRTLPSAEIYWIDNRSSLDRRLTASFRCSGRKASLWHPETGEISELSYSFENGRTVVPLEFNAGEAYFVVLGEPAKEGLHVRKAELDAVSSIEGPWNVTFQAGRGAPESAVFNKLSSWSESSDPGIRYFSGTAVYRASFDFQPSEGRFELDLGKVCNIVEVRLNGQTVRTLWRAPFRVDVTDALKAGENKLELAVTNLWPNRLIGDEQPGAKRVAYTTWPFYKASDPLLPSGLMGPVRILSYDVAQDYSSYANPEFAKAMDEVSEISNLNHCPYDLAVKVSADTPAPSGYSPFYITHYGRHGSRTSSESSDEEALKAASVLRKAEARGALTAEGRALASELEAFVAATDGMYGRLTPRGRREHAAIAERMYRRFSPVFPKGSGRIEVLSSIYPRCLMSMASFTNKLKECDPSLEIDMDCGEKYQKFLLDKSDKELRALVKKTLDSVYASFNPDCEVMIERLFKDRSVAAELVPDPVGMARKIWHAAYICGALDLDFDMNRHLPLNVRYALAEEDNLRIYLSQCNSLPFGDIRMKAAAGLKNDILAGADKAVEGDPDAPCANLRFGHDWPLLLISSALGLEGIGERYSIDEASRHFVTTRYAPFAGNLQLIFYRSRKASDPVLVKCLLNERETAFIGLDPVSGPYYRWSDVRERLL
jgi:hypothetical protein